MPYLEFDLNLPNHPKTAYAARLAGIGIPQLIGHLTCLWTWAIDYASDGDLTAYPPEVIEAAMQWTGDPGALLAALIDCRFGPKLGFVESDTDGIRIHDWWEHAGKLIERRRSDAERKRELRSDRPSQPPVAAPSAGRPMDVAAPSAGRPMDVAAPSAGRPMDVAGCLDITEQNIPDQNKPDQNKPEQTKSPPPPIQSSPRAEKRARHRQNGGGGVGDLLTCPGDYSAEQWAAWNLAVRAAPNFNGLDDFLRQHPPQLVAYWCLAAEDGVPKVENPAGLIRSGVEKGDYPRLRGELSDQWQAMIRSGQAWRQSRTT